MLAQNLCRQTDCLVRSKRSVRVYIQGQLVVIRNLAHTCILHGHVDALHRGVDGVHCNHADGKLIVFILIRADIAAALCDGKLHIELTVRTAA